MFGYDVIKYAMICFIHSYKILLYIYNFSNTFITKNCMFILEKLLAS